MRRFKWRKYYRLVKIQKKNKNKTSTPAFLDAELSLKIFLRYFEKKN